MANQEPGKGYQAQGRFMYADYSPLEDDRNLVEVIKDLTTFVSRLAKIDVKNKKLISLLSDSDGLRTDIVAAIKQIKTNTKYAMEKFYDEHSDVLANELVTTGAALLMDTKNSLSELLGNTEMSFDQQHSKYKEGISSGINENNTTATSLVQSWLANEYRNLPRPIVSNLVVTVTAMIDRNNPKTYGISRTTTSSTAAATTVQGSAGDPRTDYPSAAALQFSYTFGIDGTDLEFWNHRKIVADLGIKDLMLPVGMRASVSEKIKQTFRLRKDAEISKEPEFVKADNYHVQMASLTGGRTLVVELAGDATKSETDVFRISYDISSLPDSLTQSAGRPHPGSASLPKIDYRSYDGGKDATDLLQIGEIEQNSDLSKIRLLGAAILSELMTLQSPEIVQSRAKLKELKTHDTTVVIPSAVRDGNYDPLFEFLESVASSFAPFVRKMREKTSMHGELVLREELGGGQRREFTVRIDELKALLKDTKYGNRISMAMGFDDSRPAKDSGKPVEFSTGIAER